MDKEIKSINEVQDAEAEATKLVERALSKKQKEIEDANSEARKIMEDAEHRAKEEIAASVITTQKELERLKGDETKATHKAVEQIKKMKLSQSKIKEISERVAKEIAGE
ncbi:MAG: hypothetical protein KGH71_00290 [Candidatus Micrarchaeota archaeon]|nr:hypothetical protein [Candidatus Micrarchaeota archaeon]